MKNFTLLAIAILLIQSSFAQTPKTFNYQAVIRDASGNIKANTEVNLDISIIQGSEFGTAIYSENWNIKTNSFGLVNLEIGSKDIESFKAINWMNGPYYISLSADGEYLGASPLLSVPFAQLAQRAIEGDADADPTSEFQNLSISGNELSITNGSTITLPESEKQILSISGHILSISEGNEVKLPDDINDADADPTNELELPAQLAGDANKVLAADGSGGVSCRQLRLIQD